MVLTSASGDARTASDLFTANITVRQNDDPINFTSNYSEVEEGATAVFSVARGGQANGRRALQAPLSILTRVLFLCYRRCHGFIQNCVHL